MILWFVQDKARLAGLYMPNVSHGSSALVGAAALRLTHGHRHGDARAFGLWRIKQAFKFLKQFTQAFAQLVQRALFLLCHSRSPFLCERE